jgi:hypothetical protein
VKSSVGEEFPIGNLKNISVLWAEGREDPMSGRAMRSATASEWYQSKEVSLLSVAEKKEIHHATKERQTVTQSRG